MSMYTVQRVRKDDSLYGPTHGSMDCYKTDCGQDVGENWWVLTNDFSGVPTCKKCLKGTL